MDRRRRLLLSGQDSFGSVFASTIADIRTFSSAPLLTAETEIAGALTKTSTLSGPLLAGLLLVPTLGMAAAPFNSWAARHAALPAWLRERRDTEYRRERHVFAAGVATGGAIVVGTVAALAIALMLTGRLSTGPSIVRPLQSPPATTSTPVPSITPTSTQAATSTATTTPTVSPTVTTTATATATPTVSPTAPPPRPR